MSLLATMTASGWRPGPGDPTVGGWLVFFGYLAAGFLALRAYRWEQRGEAAGLPRLPKVWKWLAIALFLLALNKQLDLHTAITWYGRQMARSEGWYRSRREVQMVAMLALAGLAAAVVAFLFLKIGREHPRYLVPLTGVTLLVAFILVRAASFHHVDAVLGGITAGIKVHALTELAGIAVLSFAAYRTIHQHRGIPD